MKKSAYFDQNILEIMNVYNNHITTKYRKIKLVAKLKRQKVILDYDTNVLSTDYGCFNFDEKDTFKVIYKDKPVFCNCNRNLECLIAKYRKLKGGE